MSRNIHLINLSEFVQLNISSVSQPIAPALYFLAKSEVHGRQTRSLTVEMDNGGKEITN